MAFVTLLGDSSSTFGSAGEGDAGSVQQPLQADSTGFNGGEAASGSASDVESGSGQRPFQAANNGFNGGEAACGSAGELSAGSAELYLPGLQLALPGATVC